MKMDLKTIAVIVGLLGSFSAAAGAYAVLHYRVAELEKAGDKIDDLKCYVAKLHKQELPGC